MNDIPETVEINEIRKEAPSIRTFFLDTEIDAVPGQFIMVWLPRVDEKPFALSYIGGRTGITVKKRGKFTKKLFGLEEGDLIGVRGPYGNGFEPEPNSVVVAGGIGIAPLAPLIEELKNPYLILGADSESELVFKDRFNCVAICTEDGGLGFEGLASDYLIKKVDLNNYDAIYTSGPELMIRKIIEVNKKFDLNLQASLERYMKCGMGVCGQCELNGYLVCEDGPVFSNDELREMKDLGKYARAKTGEKIPISEYFD